MKPELSFILVLAVATAVALFVRRFRVPYTLALVVAGLAIGASRMVETPRLTKELLYALCLPGLVFEAALHLKAKDFARNKISIVGLAVPGLLAAIGLTAVSLGPLLGWIGVSPGLGIVPALVFAALIGATDPIAVVALFKSLGAPKRLGVLVEGESLFNDGTAIVVFTLLHAFATGAPTTVAGAVVAFATTVGGGLAIGGGVGFVCARLMKLVNEPMIEITITTLGAYGSFAAAEQLHLSGVLATVTAGMITGSYAMRASMEPSTRIAVTSFWAYVAFALNSVVFLLIGFEVDLGGLLRDWKPILVAWVVVLVVRAVVVFTSQLSTSFTRERFPHAWAVVMTWGGLRGALSMVLVIGLEARFEHRSLLVHMTFGVVLLSLLVQGLTMAPLLRALGLSRGRDELAGQYELRRGRVVALQARLGAIGELQRGGRIHVDLARELEERTSRELADAEAAVRGLRLDHEQLRAEERQVAERHLLLVSKSALVDAHHGGVVGEEALGLLTSDIDAALDEVEGEGPPSARHAPSAERDGAGS